MRGWRRTALEGYCEKHHIIPKCLGGDNCESNLVKLTAREHYLAHLLLIRVYPNASKLFYSIMLMAGLNGKKLPSRTVGTAIEIAKLKARALQRGKKFTDEHKKKLSLAKKGKPPANKGVKATEEKKEKLKAAWTRRENRQPTLGIKLSAETRAKMSASAKAKPPMSEATKLKISEAVKGRRHSEETRAKMSAIAKARPPMTEESRLNRSLAQKRRFQKIKDKKEILQFWCAL